MNRLAVIRTYSGALAGIHVFLILDFQDQKNIYRIRFKLPET